MAHERELSASARYKGRLRAVFLITLSIMFVEIVAGLISGSLALLADAGHMLTDVAGVGLALFARRTRRVGCTTSTPQGCRRIRKRCAISSSSVRSWEVRTAIGRRSASWAISCARRRCLRLFAGRCTRSRPTCRVWSSSARSRTPPPDDGRAAGRELRPGGGQHRRRGKRRSRGDLSERQGGDALLHRDLSRLGHHGLDGRDAVARYSR